MSQHPRLGLTRMSLPLVVWALHFVVIYSLQGLACARGLWRMPVAGLEAMTWALWAVTVAAWLAIALLTVGAWQVWRRRAVADASGRAVDDRREFLAVLGLLVASIAAVGVLFTVVPVALLPTCA